MRLLIILFTSILLISGCNANNAQSEVTASKDHNKRMTEIEVMNVAGVQGLLSGSMYDVASDWSIQPLNEDANEEIVLLTIDDAPDEHALEMANTLKDLDANAIFFVNGHFLETDEEKEVIKQIYDMGFVIGNHTYSHTSLPTLSEEEQKKEIVLVNDMVEDITGERPYFFRAPFGENTDYSKRIVQEENMTLMNWTYGYDWEEAYMTPSAIKEAMINSEYLRDGANLLMHDREWTSEALKEIVEGIRNRGFEAVDPLLIETD